MTASTVNLGATAGNARSGPGTAILEHPAFVHLQALIPLEDMARSAAADVSGRRAAVGNQGEVVETLARVLFRTRRHHAVLCGHAGTGRTSILREFGEQVSAGTFSFLQGYSVLYMDVANIGEEDSRAFLETVLSGIAMTPRVLLLIDGFGTLFRRPGGGTNKPLIRTVLSRSELRVVGSMSPTEYLEHVANDSLLNDAIAGVNIGNADCDDLHLMVRHAALELEQRLGVDISDSVAVRTQELTASFLIGEHEPRRTVEVLRAACDRILYRNCQHGDPVRPLTDRDIAMVISEKTGLSVDTILGLDREHDFRSALEAGVVGQTDAVLAVARELEMISAGLNDPHKPATVLMFAGLTGVGKTELARRVARLYSPSGTLRVYPMGNFTEPHSVSGLIGVPPGYVGHEDGGRLVNDLLADPCAVFLLDEAEKCHPNVWKPFLTLFDEGWIVDQRGRRAYGDRAIFILTTNAGDRSISQLQQSDKSAQEISDHVRKTLSRVRHERSSQPVFPPQFLSRIRQIIVFRALDEQAMCEIAALQVEEMVQKWKRIRNRSIQITPAVVQWIGQEAFRLNALANGEEGGRIVRKLVQERIEYLILGAAVQKADEYQLCTDIVIQLSGSHPEQIEVVLRTCCPSTLDDAQPAPS